MGSSASTTTTDTAPRLEASAERAVHAGLAYARAKLFAIYTVIIIALASVAFNVILVLQVRDNSIDSQRSLDQIVDTAQSRTDLLNNIKQQLNGEDAQIRAYFQALLDALAKGQPRLSLPPLPSVIATPTDTGSGQQPSASPSVAPTSSLRSSSATTGQSAAGPDPRPSASSQGPGAAPPSDPEPSPSPTRTRPAPSASPTPPCLVYLAGICVSV